MRFLRHFNLDFTYYNTKTQDQTFEPNISTGSGSSKLTIQSGNVRNRGFEVALGYSNTWGKFSWDSNSHAVGEQEQDSFACRRCGQPRDRRTLLGRPARYGRSCRCPLHPPRGRCAGRLLFAHRPQTRQQRCRLYQREGRDRFRSRSPTSTATSSWAACFPTPTWHGATTSAGVTSTSASWFRPAWAAWYSRVRRPCSTTTVFPRFRPQRAMPAA